MSSIEYLPVLASVLRTRRIELSFFSVIYTFILNFYRALAISFQIFSVQNTLVLVVGQRVYRDFCN